MAEPLQALLWGGLFLVFCGFLFWPSYGYFWRLQRARRMTERVLIEDVLKHLYHSEYRRQTATVESLSGALEVSGNEVAGLVARAEAMGLLRSEEAALHLTTDGRNQALHVIRVHRLWEHHLAEETGVEAADWHGEAEAREHDLTPEEANSLSYQMGNPVYDPHGDPIPTQAGEIAPSQGKPLTDLDIGQQGRIVHVEDEPEAIYAQLVAEGLNLGMQVQVFESTGERMCFWANGEEHILAPILAANISVIPVAETKSPEMPSETLAALKEGEVGRVIQLSQNCRGLERRRLMDLGILPGTLIGVDFKSPVGDPTAYRVRGSIIALRKEQASQIYITRQTEAA